ncbi:hypothetical protein [Streptomyces sp. NPDC086777]|uniref:hypothetical protein n=1 Tax=Streptomyces sp. NPDC086777 TaxID=3154866 RepID=UPI00344F6B01
MRTCTGPPPAPPACAAAHSEALRPVLARLEPSDAPAPERLHDQGLTSTRTGPAGLLRDLLDLYQLVNLVDVTWAQLGRAACPIRDRELLHIVDDCSTRTVAQLDWVRMRMRTAGPPNPGGRHIDHAHQP